MTHAERYASMSRAERLDLRRRFTEYNRTEDPGLLTFQEAELVLWLAHAAPADTAVDWLSTTDQPDAFTLTDYERELVGRLLDQEYDRIKAMPTEEPTGFTLGAKAASLADVILTGRKLGLVIGDTE